MSDSREMMGLFSPEKREMFARLLKKKGLEISRSQAIPKRVKSLTAPLLFAQERLWFLQQLDPADPSYNLDFVVYLHGILDVIALERSVQEILRRHESLRTTFQVVDEQPVQIIAPALTLPLMVGDLQGLHLEMHKETVLTLVKSAANHPFDLERGPLLHFLLLRLSERQHVLVLIIHHIISDDGSIQIFMRELAMLYAGYLQGKPSVLAELPIQYADFARWHREWLLEGTLDEQLGYWKEQLRGIRTLELPTDRPRPAILTTNGAQQVFNLSVSLSKRLRKLSQARGTTLFMLLLAVFDVLLMRYTNQEDIVIGTPIVNRNRSEIEDLIGFFLNTLVLRVQLSNHPTFLELLEHVRCVVLAAYAHQDVPFEKLVEALQPERNLARSPIFQIMFTLRNVRHRALQMPGLSIEPLSLPSERVKFDLSLEMVETEQNITGIIKYNTDLFAASSIARMTGHLQMLLESIVEKPEQRITHLTLMPFSEAQTLRAWNATQLSYTQRCIHQLFEIQVERTSDACAVVFKDEQLTYGALNQRANQVARYLQKLKIGPEARVGVYVERSLEMVIGLLGILKAGGAYVPLDPTYPRDRISFMIEDAQLAVLVTQQSLFEEVSYRGLHTVCLDTDWETIAEESLENINGEMTVDNLAYIIYTSGSTGKPKGVMVEHRNVANFFAAMNRDIEHSRHDERAVWLAITSISFDISVLELFWTLTHGFLVIIQASQREAGGYVPVRTTQQEVIRKPVDFSLFYFADNAEMASDADKYRLLLEGARFADQHNFAAIWTPERHFHPFGGLYPNPAVVSAAIATVTKRIGIRAGSVVLPLHQPLRVVEEWSVVDNLSQGRVGLSFAPGWHANDFVLAPDRYASRREVMAHDIETVRRLWRGEAISLPNGVGNPVAVKIFPRPVQSELPIWITAGGSPETFKLAGQLGAGLLTHLLGQSVEELAEKIALYRTAWRETGHASGGGHVTLMLHTFVGNDGDVVREKVRKPFCSYLQSSFNLIQALAQSLGYGKNLSSLSLDDMDVLLSHAFDRYYETSGLLGTPQTCLAMIRKLQAIGVDEIACLIDFGVDTDSVLSSLTELDRVRRLSQKESSSLSRNLTIQEQIERYNVSHLQCTPSLASMMAADPHTLQAFHKLQVLLLGGEALPLSLAEQLQTMVTGTLRNMYGPTETTVWSATHVVGKEAFSIPIGCPIANTQIYILDRYLQPLPVGIPGELFIGGDGVTRGYLKHSELTAERFIPDPFSETSGARLYRTGDLASYQSDGNICYLGRMDQQVKLRGFRIELEEIEAVLYQHVTLKECVVIVREDSPGDKHLVAYVVAHKDVSLSINDLRRLLREQLPEYMIPTSFVVLSALPLTPNGKVNRNALPAPESGNHDLTRSIVPPRNVIEEILVGLWSDILNLEEVGIDSNFFELGGHSLLATRLISRIRAVLQVDVPLRSLFEAQTIASLSEHIEGMIAKGQGIQTPPILPLSWIGNSLPLSFAQQRLWFLHQLEPHTSLYNVFAALRMYGELNVHALEQSVQEIIERHESLRASFLSQEGQPVLEISNSMCVDISITDLRNVSADTLQVEIYRLAVEEARVPFDMSSGRLLRIKLLRLSEQEHILLVTMHHIISDAWSRGVFVRELSAFYTAILEGKPSPLAALPVQYTDFAAWQRDWLQGRVLEQQVNYWQHQLRGAAALELPTDRPRSVTQTYTGANYAFALPAQLVKALGVLGRQEGATLFMLLLATFQILLYRYTGQEDIIVGTDIANRTREETEALIGFFINMLVLRTNMGGKPSFRNLLSRVREMVLGAYTHQDLPFEMLVNSLRLERKGNRVPLVNVLFVLQNAPMSRMELPFLTIKPFEVEEKTAKFDMAVFLSEDTEGLRGYVNYSIDLFDASTIATLVRCFEMLLESIVSQPDLSIDALEIYSEAEKDQRATKAQESHAAKRKELKLSKETRISIFSPAEHQHN